MAKAKKTETTDGPKRTATKAKAAVKPAATAPPLIDTNLAAAAAAKGLVAGLSAGGPATPAGATPKSSASFEKLKESLGKPTGGLGSALDKSGPTGLKKPPQGFGTNRPTIGGGRNQTFGADVNRASVPRRTGGG